MSTALAKRQTTEEDALAAARPAAYEPEDDVASASLRSGALLCDAMGYQENVEGAAERAAAQLVERELRDRPGAPPRLPSEEPHTRPPRSWPPTSLASPTRTTSLATLLRAGRPPRQSPPRRLAASGPFTNSRLALPRPASTALCSSLSLPCLPRV